MLVGLSLWDSNPDYALLGPTAYWWQIVDLHYNILNESAKAVALTIELRDIIKRFFFRTSPIEVWITENH